METNSQQVPTTECAAPQAAKQRNWLLRVVWPNTLLHCALMATFAWPVVWIAAVAGSRLGVGDFGLGASKLMWLYAITVWLRGFYLRSALILGVVLVPVWLYLTALVSAILTIVLGCLLDW